MKSKKLSIIKSFLVMTILGTFFITGCKKIERSDELNIGYFNNITHSQALLMKSEGILEEKLGEDVSINWTAFNAGPMEVEALLSGSIDIGFIGPVPALTAGSISEGEIKVLAGVSKGGSVLVKREGTDINSAADLAGKIVAVPQLGNTQHLCLLDILERAKLKTDTDGGNVAVVAISNADVGNAMSRGDIDAAIVPEPWGTTLLENGAKLVLDYDEICYEGDYDVAVVVVRNSFLEHNPDIVRTFLDAHRQMTDELNSRKKECMQRVNNEINEATGKLLNDSVITDAYGRIGFYAEYNMASMDLFLELIKKNEIVKKVPEEVDYYVNNFE